MEVFINFADSLKLLYKRESLPQHDFYPLILGTLYLLHYFKEIQKHFHL